MRSEEIDNTKISILYLNRVKGRVLYLTMLFFIIVAVSLLPVIKISLSIQGRGIIRPVSEITRIKAIQTEQVVSINISEGRFINNGDTLLMLRQDILENKLDYLRQELLKHQNFTTDLDNLISQSKIQPKTNIFAGQLNSYKQKLDELDGEIAKAGTELDWNKSLFEREFISKKDYYDLLFNLNQLKKKKNILESNQISRWKADLEKYSTSINEFSQQISELEKQKQFYVITSPVSGTIEEFSGIYVGSMLQTGQTIAVISPESDKIAEIYVSAKDIGYLTEGQVTKIQVDAFNYNQWGSIPGEIIDISDDFLLLDKTPVFHIKCKLDKDYLELKNGVKGKLKKGMTVNARFMIARRSLFDLLYQKSDDWLNPSRNLASR